MNKLQTQLWSEETDKLLAQTREVLLESEMETVREMALRLPSFGETEDVPIRIVFAGQYGSGKSTIIKALTGKQDVTTGAGITTDQVQDYDWNGITITDTPGIHTSVRPEHDEAGYRAISEADLLVFVVTNELFDNYIGLHYRKLTVEHDKGHETVVVVNKIGRHAEGNSQKSRAILTNALREPLKPFTPEEVRLTFIDAESALEAGRELDPEVAEMLREQGNMGALVDNLNGLVRDKRLISRHTTKLYSAQQALTEALEGEDRGDPDADALLLVYNQNIRAITQSATSIRGEVELAIIKGKNKILQAGDVVNDILDAERSETGEKRAIDTAQTMIRETTEELDESIAKALLDALPPLKDRIEAMQQYRLHQEVALRLGAGEKGADWNRGLGVIQSLAGRLGESAGRIARNNTAGSVGKTGMSQFSGSQGHRAVLRIGHTFGHSFQPWEAVRLTQKIGQMAAILSAASIALDVAMDLKELRDEQRRERESLKARQDVKVEFDRVAGEVELEARSTLEDAVSELLEEPLQQITNARDQINLAREERNKHLGRLNSVEAAVGELIRRIHSGE